MHVQYAKSCAPNVAVVAATAGTPPSPAGPTRARAGHSGHACETYARCLCGECLAVAVDHPLVPIFALEDWHVHCHGNVEAQELREGKVGGAVGRGGAGRGEEGARMLHGLGRRLRQGGSMQQACPPLRLHVKAACCSRMQRQPHG